MWRWRSPALPVLMAARPAKPVGTVWFCAAARQAAGDRHHPPRRSLFGGGSRVRAQPFGCSMRCGSSLRLDLPVRLEATRRARMQFF